MIPVLAISAWSGTGKTTLLKKLIPALCAKGIRPGLIKHTHHNMDVDKPGKDSYELRKAGAAQTMVASNQRWALMTETPDEAPLDLAYLVSRMDHSTLDLVLVEGEQEAVVAEINALVREKQAAGLKVGVVATDETESLYQADYVVTIGARSDEDAIARHLYKILREFDDWNVDAIYSESFSTPRIGQAIMNRLMKAAGHQVIHV